MTSRRSFHNDVTLRLLLAAAAVASTPPSFAQALGVAASAAPTTTVVTPQVRATLVAHAPQGLVPGAAAWLGLRIEHRPGWHTYWKNPGDSGLPTTLAWTLPEGFEAGDIEWPAPRRLPVGPLMNHGYEGALLLPVALRVPAGHAGDAVEVRLRAEWLVCKDVCIPEGGDFALRLPARSAVAGDAALFDAALAARPQALVDVRAQATLRGDPASALAVRVDGLPRAWQQRPLTLFPEVAGAVHNAAPQQGRWEGASWHATLALDPQRTASPARMPVVLTLAEAGPASGPGSVASVRVDAAVEGRWPPLPTPGAMPAQADPGAAAPVGFPTTATAFGGALLLALLGGALLNLMPCVFPVLSMKMLAAAGKGADRRAMLAGGLAYSAGVVLSFVALAALLLVLRGGGEQLGWGFQLQSPGFVAALAALFTLVALNLAGMFEIGGVLPSSWLAARARHPVVDSLLTGVLAVAVAAPCTAPFMGASLGLAVTLPAAQALAVFAALGVGMALPYLGATAWPPLVRALPRPGPWMAHFRAAMAFPMLATVVWLVWVLGQQTGVDGAAALLAVLLAMAFAAWALGSPALGPRARRGFGSLALALLAAALWAGLPALRHEAPPQADAAAAAPGAVAPRWAAWSIERVAQAHAEGRPVFVDFTAAWCVTCQLNKGALSDAEVLAAFDARRVLLLRADWTRRDAAIAAELQRLGRSGVPVYAIYAPGGATPRLLGELLSRTELLEAVGGLP